MKYLATIAIVIGIAAVIVVGVRLSGEQLGLLAATLIGVAGGVCGAVPVSVVLVWALVRRTKGRGEASQQQNYPPVIVIGGNGQPMNLSAPPSPFEQLPAPKRSFKVVPDDGEWEDV